MKEERKLSAIIVDDEEGAINMMETLLGGIKNIQILGTESNADKVITLYLKTRPDIIFLDIHLGSSSGLNILNELHSLKLFPIVVFTTAHEKYALNAIREGAFDYLLKPIDPEELEKVILKIRGHKDEHYLEERINKLEKLVKNHNKLRFNTRSGFLLLHPDEILYIEASANYSEIYLSKSRHEVVSMNIGTIEEMLPEQFIRISRHHIINSTYLVRLSGVNKKCQLEKDSEEVSFTIPEKQLPDIKRHFDAT